MQLNTVNLFAALFVTAATLINVVAAIAVRAERRRKRATGTFELVQPRVAKVRETMSREDIGQRLKRAGFTEVAPGIFRGEIDSPLPI
jgi:hypothetical protein